MEDVADGIRTLWRLREIWSAVEIEVTVLSLPIYTEHPGNSTFGLIVNRDVLGDPLRIPYAGFNHVTPSLRRPPPRW